MSYPYFFGTGKWTMIYHKRQAIKLIYAVHLKNIKTIILGLLISAQKFAYEVSLLFDKACESMG